MRKKLKILFCLLLFSFCKNFSFSQNILWQKTFGGTGEDALYSVSETSDGGYILAGYTKPTYNIYLVKTDSNGDSLWTRIINWGEYAYDIKETNDYGYIITGQFWDTTTGQYSIGLLKTDGSGNPQWVKRFGGTICCNWGSGVVQLSDGGYAVVGTEGGLPGYPDGNDIRLIRTDSNGNMLWSKKYGGSKADITEYHSLNTTKDGGFILSGETRSFSDTTYTDIFLIRTDSNGDTLWAKTFGVDTLWESAYSIYETSDKGFIATGEEGKFPSVMENMYTVKTDSNGNAVWIKTYGGPAGEYSYDAIKVYSGYAIAGWTDSFGAKNRDGYVVRTDTNGNQIWSVLIGGNSPDGFVVIKHLSDGSLILGGNTYSFGNGDLDLYLVKISDTLTSIFSNEAQEVKGILFPNPFSEKSVLYINNINLWPEAEMKVFDSMGKEIRNIKITNAMTSFYKEGLSAGIYFYAVTSKTKFLFSGKFIIQ
ncbi:MAG: T9SS type A sorting domain-containing protein [Bacteroidetes bacterium]|nr:T9SS type A sorting domain-containing protein [Bacteroidota bacterium]